MYDEDIDFGLGINARNVKSGLNKKKIVVLASVIMILVIILLLFLFGNNLNFESKDNNNFLQDVEENFQKDLNYLVEDLNKLNGDLNNSVISPENDLMPTRFCKDISNGVYVERFAVFADQNHLDIQASPANQRARFILIIGNNELEEIIENPFRLNNDLNNVLDLIESKNVFNVLVRFPRQDIQEKLEERQIHCYISNDPINIVLIENNLDSIN